MGLHDRNWYQDRYKKQNENTWDTSYSQPTNRSRLSNQKFSFLYIVFFFLLFIFSADGLLIKAALHKKNNHEPIIKNPHIEAPKLPELIPGGVILRADPQGHFRGTVLINDVLLPFLIDTGATQTVVPLKMAHTLKLPLGRQISVTTAGGQVLEYETHLDSLKLGSAEIKNVTASVNQHLDEVLIGMNTLKHFHLTQESNTLTLVLSNNSEEIAEIQQELPIPDLPPEIITTPEIIRPQPLMASRVSNDNQSFKPPQTSWKKTVLCDGDQCKTMYGKAR